MGGLDIQIITIMKIHYIIDISEEKKINTCSMREPQLLFWYYLLLYKLFINSDSLVINRKGFEPRPLSINNLFF